jgi:hypothetical protein
VPTIRNLLRRIRIAAHPTLRAGDWVEVKSKEAILASLDHEGNLDGMPFMPEMLKYSGRRFRVNKRAHKTCEYTNGMESRRLPSTVHLEGVRCTGDAHGGCQAECLLFWKDTWLTKVESASRHGARVEGRTAELVSTSGSGCTEADLEAATTASTEPETIYSCQATRIRRFTTPLRSLELDQYVEAYASRNVALRDMVAPIVFRVYDRIVRTRLGATGIPQRVYDVFQRLHGGLPYPHRPGKIPSGHKTPRGEPLNLQPGELVRVKSFERILETINYDGLNRGLLFSQEHVPYCGQVFRVHSRVNRIVDEKNGKLLNIKSDCIILENVVCQARYNASLTFCPRADYPYWRELWLERVDPGDVSASEITTPACNPSVA